MLLRGRRILLDGLRNRLRNRLGLRDLLRRSEYQRHRAALLSPPLVRVDTFDLDAGSTAFGVTELFRCCCM